MIVKVRYGVIIAALNSRQIHRLIIHMEDKTYQVIIKLKWSGEMDEKQCECPRAKWICSHIAVD